MFRIPQIPSISSHLSNLADFAEIQCILCSPDSLSEEDFLNFFNVEGDEFLNGVEKEEDSMRNRIAEVFEEINRRRTYCNNNYPFIYEPTTHSIDFDPTDTLHKSIYCFLLLSTRLDMNRDKIQNSYDGTALFEHFSANIIKNYWGPRSESFVFGTGNNLGNFTERVNHLISRLGEGGEFANPNPTPPVQQDGGVDICIWTSFTDSRTSKLIGFGQCKTGTSWRETNLQFYPSNFCSKWFKIQPALSPIRVFCLAEALGEDRWNEIAKDVGLLFDRCRLLDFLNPISVDTQLADRMTSWVSGALMKTRESYFSD